MSKRKRPDEENETKLLNLIRSKEGMGATLREIKADKTIPQAICTRLLNSLKKNNLVKEVPTMNNKGVKHFLAVEFQPCKELTGGDWYIEGTLNLSKIEDLKSKCLKLLERCKRDGRIVTFEIMCGYFKHENVSADQVKEILNNLVLDNLIMEFKSNGLDELAGTRIGQVCYKLTGKKSGNGEVRAGALASVPCGACPQIALCTPDGVISPSTCAYFQKWLDF